MRRSQRKQEEPDLGILSSRTLFGLQRELFKRLSEQGHSQLRPRHGAVMAYLDEEGSRATDLAAQSGQHKQVIGTLVDELVELGYVERQPDPADRRAKLIVPTEKGRDQMAKSDAVLVEMEAAHARAVGEQAYADFKRVFKLIVERQTTTGQTDSSTAPPK
ncbi:MarR family winged helix-turn-helix transcriptional regulator [Nonomuraea sp. H19]|uniref:MarR family winged helix-turn-helix transcriptional regulator n=1 Tax=Nonomuraea sp. H19 TaxID=3452206 RepID=UPI003F8BEBB5